MQKWIISGYINMPIYEVVEADSEDEAFNIFHATIKEEYGNDVDYDYVTVDEE